MFLHARGHGWTAILLAFFSLVAGVALVIETTGDPGIFRNTAYVGGLFCLVGVVGLVFGLVVNRKRWLVVDVGDDGMGRPDPSSARELSYRPRHPVYWISVDLWGVLLIVAGIALIYWA